MTTAIATSPVVLIVDDDLFGMTMLTELITGFSETTKVCFTDPGEAMSWLVDNTPDVIVTDYEMPDINGIDFIRSIRRSPETADVPILMITGAEDPRLRLGALEAGANDFITKPFDSAEVKSRVRNMLALRAGQQALKTRAETLAHEVQTAISSIITRERETIIRLARAAEFRDPETAAHIQRIGEYAGVISRELVLPAAFQEAICLAAPMHDIGKIGIPDHILRKSGPLTRPEYEVMKTHTAIGHQILEGSSSALLQLAAEIALCHHERWDGSGYPNGLAATEIPLAGRVVALADVFDALSTRRSYKDAWTTDDAFRYLRDNAGVQFDPECVEAFIQASAEVVDIRKRLAE